MKSTGMIALFALMVFALFAASAWAQTDSAPSADATAAVGGAASEMDLNIVSAMFKQVLNSPGSLLVIVGLSILAWLIEISVVNNKVIPWICVLGGAGSYWLFSSAASVPKDFPHPAAVLVVNGLICGFVAFVLHGQLISRFLVRKTVSPLIAVGLSGALLAGGLTGCKTRQPDGTVVFDPVKTQNVKDALQAPIERAAARIIVNSPQHSAEIAKYFAAVGLVFCEMKDSGQFDPTTLLAGLDRALPANVGSDETFQYLLDFKSAAAALYKQFWNDRFRAELPPDQWPYQVADLFCASIDQALKDAGQPGIR